MRCDASILHADLDSFYASVEQRDDPTLRGRPVIVGAASSPLGLDTVADVAELSESTLASLLGIAMGRQLFALSRNIDRRLQQGQPVAHVAVGHLVDATHPGRGPAAGRRYGRSALTPAVLLGRDAGLEMPHLPDCPRPLQ